MKIVTLCGSLRFKKEMMEVAEKLALLGDCVLTPVYPTSENSVRTKEQLIKLREAHFKKIELSDAIFVVNVNNYIGESTKLEIEYAKNLEKKFCTILMFNFETLKPIITNMIIMIGFAIIFIVLTNIASKKKNRIKVALKMLLFLLEVFYYKVLYSLQICNKM